MNRGLLKQKLTEEGYTYVYEWKDVPNIEYPPHAHTDKVALYILEGGLTFKMGGKDIILKEGERFDVPVAEEHTAKVGPDGCYYLVGEMIEGDS